MTRMWGSREVAAKLVWAAVLALLAMTACSRPLSVPADETTQTAQHQAPFQQNDAAESDGPALASQSSGQEGHLPFEDGHGLPVGTLLTVRLNAAVAAAGPHSFEATVDEPVILQGTTMIPRGAMVAGRVESARLSEVSPGRGYIQLALASVHVAGVDIPVQTASLFARQSSSGHESGAKLGLEQGRRLTFRFTEPVLIGNQRTASAH